jgi:hypothetical protein
MCVGLKNENLFWWIQKRKRTSQCSQSKHIECNLDGQAPNMIYYLPLLLLLGLQKSSSFVLAASPLAVLKRTIQPPPPTRQANPLSLSSKDLEPVGSSQSSGGPLSAVVTPVNLWIVCIGAFVAANYKSDHCLPDALVHIPFNVWMLVHSVSGMLFGGVIVTTTILEWMVVSSRNASTMPFWFTQVPRVEGRVVLPALTGSIVSGVAQAFERYGSLGDAPLHVKSIIHLLAAFGMWWGWTDRTTQGPALEAATSQQVTDSKLPSVLLWRRFSNLVSCLFIIVLYGIMVLKPGLY